MPGDGHARPTVFIIDDDTVTASKISGLIASQGWRVFAFRTVREFLKSQRPSGPACLVLEAALSDGRGLDLQRRLATVGGELPIVFIARRADVRAAVEVMRRGVCDLLLMPLHDRELLDAVGRALEHDREAKAKRAELAELLQRESRLTARERAVFARIVDGKLNKQVAAELTVAEGTVKVYRHRLMKKMGAASFTELVRMADRLWPPRYLSGNGHQGTLAAIRSATEESSVAGDSLTTERR
jgi:FixJ family two-component response regulator